MKREFKPRNLPQTNKDNDDHQQPGEIMPAYLNASSLHLFYSQISVLSFCFVFLQIGNILYGLEKVNIKYHSVDMPPTYLNFSLLIYI